MTRNQESSILVVDDDANDRLLIGLAFRENGVTCAIHLVSNGEEAIAYFMGEGKYADRENYPYPSFIITDLNMDRGNGFVVLQHLKANPDWAIIPTVVLSASDDADDIRRSYALGASAYHVKAPGFEALRFQLRDLYAYWMGCAVPEVDTTGKHLHAHRDGTLGEGFAPREVSVQRRVQHR